MLEKTIIKFLEKQNDWVREPLLIQLCLIQKYDRKIITGVLRNLYKNVFIGIRWNTTLKINEYRWYKMSKKDIKQQEENLEWFDSLP